MYFNGSKLCKYHYFYDYCLEKNGYWDTGKKIYTKVDDNNIGFDSSLKREFGENIDRTYCDEQGYCYNEYGYWTLKPKSHT